MPAFDREEDLPLFVEMYRAQTDTSDIELTASRAAALVAALKELFERYPEPTHCTWEGLPVNTHQARTWRHRALYLASEGKFARAIFYADNTGVPQEELIAIAALLFS